MRQGLTRKHKIRLFRKPRQPSGRNPRRDPRRSTIHIPVTRAPITTNIEKQTLRTRFLGRQYDLRLPPILEDGCVRNSCFLCVGREVFLAVCPSYERRGVNERSFAVVFGGVITIKRDGQKTPLLQRDKSRVRQVHERRQRLPICGSRGISCPDSRRHNRLRSGSS